MKKLLTALLAVLPCSFLLAQGDTAHADVLPSAKAADHAYFAASLGYISNATYNGRKDSLATPYINTTVGYYAKSGFFADAGISYLAQSGSSRIDLFSLEAGYDFSKGNFDGSVSASKLFYNKNSTNVKSEVTGTLTVLTGYDLNFIKPTLEAGINFGTNPDYFLTLGLEHSFTAAAGKLQITPGMVANGSTQNFYTSYYNKRKVGGRKKNAGVTYDVTADVQDAKKFKLLDYETTLAFVYTCHKFSFVLTPGYVIPVNPAVIVTTIKPTNGLAGTTRTNTETISNTFYISAGITLKL